MCISAPARGARSRSVARSATTSFRTTCSNGMYFHGDAAVGGTVDSDLTFDGNSITHNGSDGIKVSASGAGVLLDFTLGSGGHHSIQHLVWRRALDGGRRRHILHHRRRHHHFEQRRSDHRPVIAVSSQTTIRRGPLGRAGFRFDETACCCGRQSSAAWCHRSCGRGAGLPVGRALPDRLATDQLGAGVLRAVEQQRQPVVGRPVVAS